ncbi:MAG: DnaJ domain-containing protein [Acidobacteria bacterium]|nr:DnaJ domain-containing protein [Acidobacteriota bacterium]
MDVVEFQTQDLASMRVPWILCEMFEHKRSGTLHIMGSNRKFGRRIYVRDGNIKFALSNQESDRFGRLLLESGIITEDQFTRAILKMDGKKRFGHILLEMECITEEQLQAQLDRQVKEIVFSTFELDSGLYFLEERDPGLPPDLTRNLDFATTIISGIRAIRNLILLDDEMNRFKDEPIRFNEKPTIPLQQLPLKPEEAYALSRIDGFSSIDKLMPITRMDEDDFRRIMYAMFCLNVVSAKTERPQLVNRFDHFEEEELKDPDIVYKGNLTRDQAKERESIVRKYLEIKNENLWNFMEVSPKATPKELKEAFLKHNKSFHPDLINQPYLMDLKPYVNKILSHVNYAFNILNDPNKRESYLKSLNQLPEHAQPTLSANDRAQLAIEPYKMAVKYIHEEDFFNAHRYLEQAVRLAPNEARYLVELARIEMRNPNWLSKAKVHLNKALELDATNAKAHHLLGGLYAEQGHKPPAIQHLKQALEYDPMNDQARELLESLRTEEKVSFIDRLRGKIT